MQLVSSRASLATEFGESNIIKNSTHIYGGCSSSGATAVDRSWKSSMQGKKGVDGAGIRESSEHASTAQQERVLSIVILLSVSCRPTETSRKLGSKPSNKSEAAPSERVAKRMRLNSDGNADTSDR